MSDAASFPSPATKILILASLLVLSLIAVVYGYRSASETRQKNVAFAADSAVATGVVTNWAITNVARSPDYWLDVTFHTRDGAVRNVSANVQKPLFDNLRIGSTVPVTYVPSRPEWFYVADEIPTDRQAVGLDWLWRLGAVATVLSVIGLFFQFSRGAGGASGRGNVSVMEQPPAPSVSPASRPSGFGKRQSAG